jgi:REP element-mobilizing transposase RayT
MTAWLLTSTFYGQWLPGDPRGSVTNVLDRRPDDPETESRIEHAQPGDEYEGTILGLQRAAAEQMKGPPVRVNLAHAEALLEQFQETARHRGWDLLAVSIMYNHVHLIVVAPSDVGKSQLLRDFKSYGGRRLSQHFGKQASGTWWSDGGSCRSIRHLAGAVFYVCHRQPNPLLVWSSERRRILPVESDPKNVFRGELPPLTREARLDASDMKAR